MPYFYQFTGGIGADAFYDYLQYHMELGDTIRLFEIPGPEETEKARGGKTFCFSSSCLFFVQYSGLIRRPRK